ncbi:PIN domain-containing protein [Sphaerisporangium perillae]|uniref:PIN domain-containing protein n=1 Tax=Sphaerisporangium perillae TaxID=2935860 RepID=UPI00200DB2D3|nr:PIN domain-containing protein [Sphaerisporangium perillae]
MADLDSEFREYYPPTDEQRKVAMTSGLVCLDTNVLLDAYRFAPHAREELLNVLEKLGDRLWIPHQVAGEFHRNRIKVIGDQANAYTPALTALEGILEYFKQNVSDKIRTLGRTVALTKEEERRILEQIPESVSAAWQEIDNLRTRHGVTLDMLSNDPVLKRLEELLKGKVGARPTLEDEQKAREEAKRRAVENIPPGFADQKNKTDSSGDYLVWSQVLKEAAHRKSPILLVTRDTKDDWFRKEKGRTISARPELIREAREQAGSDLVIMETQSFLFHAREYLNATVSDELLSQVEQLPGIEHNNEIIHISRNARGRIMHKLRSASVRVLEENRYLKDRMETLYEIAKNSPLENSKELQEELHENLARRRAIAEDFEKIDKAMYILDNPQSESSTHIAIYRDQLRGVHETARLITNDDDSHTMEDTEKDPTARYLF